jgi:hypothetical protein
LPAVPVEENLEWLDGFRPDVVELFLLTARLILLDDPPELARVLRLLAEGKSVEAIYLIKAIRNGPYGLPGTLVEAVARTVYGEICPHIDP